MIGIGIVITVAHLFRDRGFGQRQRAFAARRCSRRGQLAALASLVMAVALILIEDLMPQSKEQFRFQAREGFTVIEQGNQIRSSAPPASRWSLTMPGCASSIR